MSAKMSSVVSILAVVCLMVYGMTGCASTKPASARTAPVTPTDQAALETAKTSTQASEQKFSDLHQERLKLQAELETKQKELQKTQSARDSVHTVTAPAVSDTAPAKQ
jgi:peptidoglycan hydrolase CwlO-like protein